MLPRTAISLLLLCALALPLAGQAPPPAPDLTNTIHADMNFLAGDDLRGRGSLTRDEHLAALFCASIFQSLGLKPAGDNGTFLQKIPVPASAVNAKQLAKMEDVPRSETWNAIAILPGTDPERKDEVVLLTAHLDHLGQLKQPINGDAIFNGADDDASGTTAVLNLARVLASSPPPQRTVVFALFGSEEFGGFGARGFLQHPPVPLASLVANLEFEMIGRPDPSVPAGTLWLTGYERSNLGPELAAHGAHLVQDPHPEQKFFQRSDNITLAREGIVAQTVSSFGLHHDYHQPTDEIRTIDFAHLNAAIISMEEPLRWLTNTSWKPSWNPGGRPPAAPATEHTPQ